MKVRYIAIVLALFAVAFAAPIVRADSAPSTQFIVVGTQTSGTFPGCISTSNAGPGAYCIYQEVDTEPAPPPPTQFELNIQFNFTGLSAMDTWVYVQGQVTPGFLGILAAEAFVFEVLTPPSTWTVKFTFGLANEQNAFYNLSAAEFNSGSPKVRFVDTITDDSTANELSLNMVWAFHMPPGPTGPTGATGPTGPAGANSLVATVSEPIGANCANAGIKVTSGLDNGDGGGTANDGILQAGEVDATAYVCNGLDGLNALVNMTSEPPGANCATGGVKIESGTDLNGDSVLQGGEVTDTSYACNGAQGATGPTGPTGPAGDGGDSEGLLGGLIAISVLPLMLAIGRRRRNRP